MLCSRKFGTLLKKCIYPLAVFGWVCALHTIFSSAKIPDNNHQLNVTSTKSPQSKSRCTGIQHLIPADGFQGEDAAFFFETSNSSSLNFRQACAVESLANLNPNLAVYVFKTEHFLDENSVTLQALVKSYANVNVLKIDLNEYFENTPFEQWYQTNKLKKGQYWMSHLSDALRFLTLYMHGGYYFDLDVIQLKRVSFFKNFAALEDPSYLGSSAIHVDCRHPVIEMAIEDFRNNYNPDVWGYNGPLLITRVLQDWCKARRLTKLNYINCRGFSVLPPSSFYPVHNSQWEILFSPAARKETASSKFFNNQAIGVHVWNNLNSQEPLRKDSSQLYVRIAKQQCPIIYSKAPPLF